MQLPITQHKYMPKKDNNVQFELGKFSQFKEDICKQIATSEKNTGDKFDLISNKIGKMDGKLDDLNMWRVKVISYTTGITTVAWFVLTKIF